MKELLDVSPHQLGLYFVSAVFGSLFVRLVSATTKAWRAHATSSEVDFRAAWNGIFMGCGYEAPYQNAEQTYNRDKEEDGDDTQVRALPKENKRDDDYWLPYLLGLMELLAYPMLMVSNLPEFIGAWLVFKIVHRMRYAPGTDRGLYNSFLVANAMIIVIAYCMARLLLMP